MTLNFQLVFEHTDALVRKRWSPVPGCIFVSACGSLFLDVNVASLHTAGFLMFGACRLVPEEFYQRMPSHGVPEMLRIPLYTTILKVKKLGIRESIQSILSGAIDPPNPVDIEKSVLELMEAGALTLAKSLDDIDGDLTSIGEMMSLLPLSISLSRLIILSICFRCVNEGKCR